MVAGLESLTHSLECQGPSEIDWEYTTNSDQDIETNWYWTGQPEGYTPRLHRSRLYAQQHLQAPFQRERLAHIHHRLVANRLRWLIDNVPVRTLYRKNQLNKKDGFYHYLRLRCDCNSVSGCRRWNVPQRHCGLEWWIDRLEQGGKWQVR